MARAGYNVALADRAEAICLAAYTAWYAKAQGASLGSLDQPKVLMKEAKALHRDAKQKGQVASECVDGKHYQQPVKQLQAQGAFRKAVAGKS